MLSPNSLIFPRPRYRDVEKDIVKVQDYLMYIPKTLRKERLSHLQDLRSISQEQFSRRFSCNELIQQRLMVDQLGILMGQSNSQNQYNTLSDQKFRKLRPKFFQQEKKLSPQKIETTKKTNQQPTRQKIKFLKIQESKRISYQKQTNSHGILSRYSSGQTTARSLIYKQQKIKVNFQRSVTKDDNIHIDQIPCVYIKVEQKKQKQLFIYYHANGEDLINSFQFVKALSSYFRTDVMVIEYPGYSVYGDDFQLYSCSNFKKNSNQQTDDQTLPKKILNDIPHVVSYITLLGYKLQNVSVIGRSIGTGPAVQIASKYEIGSLILLSPFANFSQVIQGLYGKVAGMIVKEPFENLSKSKEIKCPVLILHGLQDQTIHYEQSMQLTCNITSYCSLRLIENMTHNRFHFEYDIFKNIQSFFGDIGLYSIS